MKAGQVVNTCITANQNLLQLLRKPSLARVKIYNKHPHFEDLNCAQITFNEEGGYICPYFNLVRQFRDFLGGVDFPL